MSVDPNTVTTENNRIDHDPDGVVTTFPYDFQVDFINYMVVYADGVVYTEPFTMTGLGDSLGGTVVFNVAPAASIETLTLMREIPLTQETVYPVYGPFPAKSHENALDKLTWIAQQLHETLNRAWKNPVNNPGGQDDFYMPVPDAGKVLAWTEDEKGLENQPGIGTFTALVALSNKAASDSAAYADVSASYNDMAEKWAQEDVDVPVDDGEHPVGYSAYHWATKSADGGIIELATSEPTMMTFSEPQARYRSIDPLINAPNAMVKLDAAGLVPLDQMPISGALTYIAAYEGHNRCPKHDYSVPESACAEPDTRNPTERFTSYVPESGHIFVVVACDDEPALNQINLVNPDTGLYEILTVTDGDATIYADGTGGLPMGWYLYEGFANQTVLASGVVFDDTTTTIQGDELQTFNQNMDAAVAGKLAKSGGNMTGNLILANDVRIRGNDIAGDSRDILYLDNADVMRVGGTGPNPMRIYGPNEQYLFLNEGYTEALVPIRYAPAPVENSDLANKAYVDAISSIVPFILVDDEDVSVGTSAANGQNYKLINATADRRASLPSLTAGIDGIEFNFINGSNTENFNIFPNGVGETVWNCGLGGHVFLNGMNTSCRLKADFTNLRWEMIASSGRIAVGGVKLWVPLVENNLRDVSSTSSRASTPDLVGRHAVTSKNDAKFSGFGSPTYPISPLLDGVNDYFKALESDDYNIFASNITDATVLVRMELDDLGVDRAIISNYQSSNDRWRLRRYENNTLQLTMWDDGTKLIDLTSVAVFSAATWYDVVIVKKGGDIGLYFGPSNTALPLTAFMENAPSATILGDLYVGQKGDDTQFFKGLMNDVVVTHSNIFNAVPDVGLTDTIRVPDRLNLIMGGIM